MTDLNKERELEAQIEVFKKEAMELWFVPNLADTYKNKDLFSYSIIDGEVFFMLEQARQLWSFWNKAKAQAVPDTHVVVPKDPTEKMLKRGNRLALSNSQYRYDAASIYEVMLEASESGAEG
ncbi:hypothetical protein [Acinetobacter nosocomialis]|uniref:hypothetical protein n=1 Tax=Acinetobacter nosocomialis TaxID=106654 RepID=UPI00201209F3|nr:hypothetical protein [Acinetobacter nosocomialis]